MFMTLAAVVVALALGHVAQGLAAAGRRHGWFDDGLRWLGAKSRADGAWHGRWGIALALSPEAAEAYNGQQGDVWDAHADMLLATVGSLLAWPLARRVAR